MDEPCIFYILKWNDWISFYVGSPSTLVRKIIVNENLISDVLDMVMVINNHFLRLSLIVFLNAVRKQGQKFGLKRFFVSGARE